MLPKGANSPSAELMIEILSKRGKPHDGPPYSRASNGTHLDGGYRAHHGFRDLRIPAAKARKACCSGELKPSKRALMSTDPRLAIIRNLLRIYKEVLEEPAPLALSDLLRRLERQSRL